MVPGAEGQRKTPYVKNENNFLKIWAQPSIARLLKTPRATESTTPELVTLRRTAERSGALVFVAED